MDVCVCMCITCWDMLSFVCMSVCVCMCKLHNSIPACIILIIFCGSSVYVARLMVTVQTGDRRLPDWFWLLVELALGTLLAADGVVVSPTGRWVVVGFWLCFCLHQYWCVGF